MSVGDSASEVSVKYEWGGGGAYITVNFCAPTACSSLASCSPSAFARKSAEAPQIGNGAPQDCRGPPGRILEDCWTSLLHLNEFYHPPPPPLGLTAPSLPEPGRLGGRSQGQLDFLDLSNRTCRGPPPPERA